MLVIPLCPLDKENSYDLETPKKFKKDSKIEILFEGAFYKSVHPDDTSCKMTFPSDYQVGLREVMEKCGDNESVTKSDSMIHIGNKIFQFKISPPDGQNLNVS